MLENMFVQKEIYSQIIETFSRCFRTKKECTNLSLDNRATENTYR